MSAIHATKPGGKRDVDIISNTISECSKRERNMIRASEVLMRAHNEGRVCGRSYIYNPMERDQVIDIPGRIRGQLCAVGFLIEPFLSEYEFDLVRWFVAEKYGLPVSVVWEIENRYEGLFEFRGHPQSLAEIAEWLEGIERGEI